MLPHDPYAEIGSRLDLNCTILPDYNGSYNSSAIFFRHNNRNYTNRNENSSARVTVVNNVTAVLSISNVTDDMFGHFMCTLPDLRNGPTQSVTVMSECRTNSRSPIFLQILFRRKCVFFATRLRLSVNILRVQTCQMPTTMSLVGVSGPVTCRRYFSFQMAFLTPVVN